MVLILRRDVSRLARIQLALLRIERAGVRDDGRKVAHDIEDGGGGFTPITFLSVLAGFLDEFLAALRDFGHAFVAFDAALLERKAIVVGENAEEVLEQGRARIGIGGESDGALFDDVDAGFVEVNGLASEETEKVLDGRRVVFADLELIGEVEARAIAVETMTGERDAVPLTKEFLCVGHDDIANDVVDFGEVGRGKLGEFGEDLEWGGTRPPRAATHF